MYDDQQVIEWHACLDWIQSLEASAGSRWLPELEGKREETHIGGESDNNLDAEAWVETQRHKGRRTTSGGEGSPKDGSCFLIVIKLLGSFPPHSLMIVNILMGTQERRRRQTTNFFCPWHSCFTCHPSSIPCTCRYSRMIQRFPSRQSGNHFPTC